MVKQHAYSTYIYYDQSSITALKQMLDINAEIVCFE